MDQLKFKKAGMALMMLFSALLSSGQGTKKVQTYDVAAFYWPAYHHEPRLQHVFPDGKGEWEDIYTAKPEKPGHDQPKVPVWGYEDESDPRVMEKKIDAAQKHGVNVFIFDWYWYDGKPLLEDCINNGFLKAKNNDQIRFYIMWANHTANSYWDRKMQDKTKVLWPGECDRKNFDIVVDRIISQYFKHPSYYKIDGKPVFSIYELSTLIKGLGGIQNTKEALDSFRKKTVEAGFPGLHLQAILWGAIPKNLAGVPGDQSQTQGGVLDYFGFNSLTNYSWVHFISPDNDYIDWANQATAMWPKFDQEFSIPFFPHVSIGWDNNPRFPEGKQPYVRNTKPESFAIYLKKAKSYLDQHPEQPKLITINAWNEWSEGSYLEPDQTNGFGYLKAIKKIFK